MEITRSTRPTSVGPGERFAGAVFQDAVATPSGPSRVRANRVRFAPGARTAWHTHPYGRTIYVLERSARASGAAGRWR
jgi:quercetin dioxygenase-like cupin family protein